ncbi:hypothetical protein [Lactobacillus phage JNU_P5]|nr:hypothetical protein [Lactobacillus phage JNU_P5]
MQGHQARQPGKAARQPGKQDKQDNQAGQNGIKLAKSVLPKPV